MRYIFSFSIAFLVSVSARSQPYPNRPISMVVPLGPGSRGSMLRHPLFALTIAALALATLAIATEALPPTPDADLAKPPSDARVWTISSGNGASIHGHVWLWTDKSGTHWSRESLLLRGFVTEIDQQTKLGPDGAPTLIHVRGHVPEGDAGEIYEVKNGAYTYMSPVDRGSGKSRAGLGYAALGGTFEAFTVLIDAMLKAPDHALDLLPSGRAKLEPLIKLTVSNGKQKRTLTAYALTGFTLEPLPFWYDGDKFFGVAWYLNFLPEGWEKSSKALAEAQDKALAARAPALVAAIAKTPPGPIVFQNVKLYDADARAFREHMSVVVNAGRIAAVSAANQTSAPPNAQIIDGNGKTLLPGLWDNHHHYGADTDGPLLLASGITSVRDPGNRPELLMPRKARIDKGELLGTRIVPSLLIDGPGALAAQSGVPVHNEAEALAAVRRAKKEGYFGIKLYGSLDPKLVKPMADLAHKLGLRVHGHIPHGMRPLDAVHAGYDEMTHINFVMMQAMPDDIVATSNGMNRFIGTGKFARGVDLYSKEMTAYLDELAARHIAVDPTLVAFEGLYVPERSTYPAAEAPYAATLPPQLARSFLSSSMAPTPDLERATMRASFAKLKALIPELYRRHIAVLAGTDGYAFDLIRELELYVEAGMKPEDALATATIIPAETYDLAKETGSIAVGKRAELTLVNGDPSKSIAALRQVDLVMREGKLMKASELRSALGISGPPKR